jgi:hypothetical protein
MATVGPLRILGKIVFWRYPRGSWQYDILCGLILVFIFCTPRAVFDGSYFADRIEESAPAEESAPSEPRERAQQQPEMSTDAIGHLSH